MQTVFNQSLWGDEAFSAVLSLNPVSKILEIISRDTSPPLYNVILHYWYQFFGTSEVSIRALSFTYFLIAIIFVYKIGSLLFNRKSGILASALTFLNPFFFTYAFEGRMYSILALGVVASTFYYLKILYHNKEEEADKKKKKVRPISPWLVLAYGVSTAWALYSHHFAIFAVFVQLVWAVIEYFLGKRNAFRKIFKGLVIAGVLYTPWLYPLYKQTKMVGGGFWLGTPNLTDLRNLIYTYLAEGIKNPEIRLSQIPISLSHLSLYIVFAVLIIRNWFKSFKKTIILLLFFLGPILITWSVSQKFQSIFFDRYLLYTIPFAMIIVSSRRRKLSGMAIGLLLISFTIVDINYFLRPSKRPFKELASYVTNSKKEGDTLLNWNSSAHHLWESKYYKIPAPIFIQGDNLPFYTGTAQMTPQDVIRTIPDSNRIGVITSGLADEVVIANYEKESEKHFGDLKFIYFIKEKNGR